MNGPDRYPVMGIAVASQRLAYVIVDEDKLILDYAIWDFRYWNKRLLWAGLKRQIKQYQPSIVCIQDTADPECKLGEDTRGIVAQIQCNLEKQNVNQSAVAKNAVRNALRIPETATKQDMAEHLARTFPDLSRLLPAKRKEWQPEYRNMILFSALGLASVAITSSK